MATKASETKVCKICKEEKLLDQFSMHSPKRQKPRTYCKTCQVEMSQRYQGKQPLHRLQYDLKRKYDLSLEGYFALLEEQEGKCAICGNIFCDSNERRLCVDHNHETGKVRGLLCFNCNTGLGKFNDDLGLLKKTIVYLEGEI